MTTPRKPRTSRVKSQEAFNPDPLGDEQDASIGEMPDEEMVSETPDEYEAVFVQTQAPETEKPIVVEKPERAAKPAAKSGPPTLDEWQDFIGRFVLRGITEGYLNVALSDFYDDLTPRELESIRLTKDDLKEMSAPLASLAHKNKFLRSKGRGIIASADSGEAVIALLIWMRRVNRISKRHRKAAAPKNTQTVPGYVVEQENGNNGSNVGQGPEYPGGFGVFNPGTG